MDTEARGVPDELVLREWLASRDETCPVCAYNLRGLTSPVCPECSAKLSLHVGSENLRLGPWVLALVSFALALGFDGVVVILMTGALIVLPAPPSPAERRVILIIIGGFVLLATGAGAAIGMLLRKRRRWVRLGVSAQWQAAVAVFVGVGLVHAFFGWIVTRMLH